MVPRLPLGNLLLLHRLLLRNKPRRHLYNQKYWCAIPLYRRDDIPNQQQQLRLLFFTLSGHPHGKCGAGGELLLHVLVRAGGYALGRGVLSIPERPDAQCRTGWVYLSRGICSSGRKWWGVYEEFVINSEGEEEGEDDCGMSGLHHLGLKIDVFRPPVSQQQRTMECY